MKTAIAQINTTIGDFPGNRKKILEYATRARSLGAELVLFPELAICGYPPMDLLDHEAFVEQNLASLRHLQAELPPEIAVVVGYVDRSGIGAGKSLRNVAAVLRDGRVLVRQAKRLLPTYDVFDEARYFEPGTESRCFTLDGLRIGIAICEDIWWETEPISGTRYPIDPVRDLLDDGAALIVAPSASPFYVGKNRIRTKLVSSIGSSGGVPVIYVNVVGGNDSLIFDGGSFVGDAEGRIVQRCAEFVEELAIIDTDALRNPPTAPPPQREAGATETEQSDWLRVEQALVLGVRDYLAKTGFSRVHLGLSGGIDSALVAVIAARAVGPENLDLFLMPSRHSSTGSIDDAQALANNLGVRTHTLPIEEIVAAFSSTLAEEFAGTQPNVAEENIQARIRGNLLMAWSNKFGSLTLTTGNKSELAVGYATLYGDMSGGLAVIGDLFKTEVYALSENINRLEEVIPRSIIDKAPSAELRPDQRDEDSLPPYEILDRILSRYLIANRTYAQIVAEDYDPAVVREVLALVARAEYKRRQAPPVIKVSPRAFGTGRRMPIARNVYETTR